MSSLHFTQTLKALKLNDTDEHKMEAVEEKILLRSLTTKQYDKKVQEIQPKRF